MSTREIGGSSTGGTDSSDRNPAGSEGPFRPDAYAVVIGIDTYQDEAISDLQCARADAQAVYDVLVDETLGRFNPDNIELLLDEDATAEAIKTAIMLANPGDIILVAGKGHETYQEVKGKRSHFDDKEVIQEYFNI